MSRPSVELPRTALRLARLGRGALAALMLLGLAVVALPAVAAESATLRAEVVRNFEILDLSDRVVLRPLAAAEAATKLPQIELPDEGETAIVAGEELDAEELSARYGAVAEPVAALLGLDGESRRGALGLPLRNAESVELPDLPEPPTPPLPPRARGHASDARVAFGHGVTVEAGERADEVVCIAGSLRVHGEVMGNAVAVGGSARVSGKVYGDVVAIGGSLHLAETAEVYGQAVAIGGTVHRAPGAKVLGKVTQVAIGDAILRGAAEGAREAGRDRHSWFDEIGDLIRRLIGIALLALLVCLVLLVAPALAEETSQRVRGETWSAGLTGLLAELLFVPLLVLMVLVLVISIIGIPLLLLVPFLLVAVVVAALVGFAGVAQAVGRWLAARFGRSLSSRYGEALLGLAAIQVLSVFGDLLDLGGGVIGILGTVISVLGFAARFVAWTVGLGAVILGLFARRRRATEARAFVAPLPVPPAAPTPWEPISPPEPETAIPAEPENEIPAEEPVEAMPEVENAEPEAKTDEPRV